MLEVLASGIVSRSIWGVLSANQKRGAWTGQRDVTGRVGHNIPIGAGQVVMNLSRRGLAQHSLLGKKTWKGFVGVG